MIAVTVHQQNDDRIPEAGRSWQHITAKVEDPCMEKFSHGRDLRDDLLLSDPYDPAVDEARKSMRGDYGNYGGGAGFILGVNVTLDQAFKANRFF